MEKPRFQFGLKAVFAIMAGAAVLLSIAMALPPDAALGFAMAVILWVVLLAGGLVFLFTLSITLYHGIRLFGWVLKKCRPPDA
jgi:hypothetical protein